MAKSKNLSDDNPIRFHVEIGKRDRSRIGASLAFSFGLPFLFSVVWSIWMRLPEMLFLLPLLELLAIQGTISRIKGVCGIEVREQEIWYRNFKKGAWKCFSLENLHHVGYYIQLKKYNLSPAVRFFDKDSNPLKDLEFWLSEQDVYKFLSVLHRMGYPVYLALEEKNIEESSHYWHGDAIQQGSDISGNFRKK